MNRNARDTYRELHWLVSEILLNEWDPIGVAETPDAFDEYDTYVPQVISLMQRGGGLAEAADFLRKTAGEQMALYPGQTGALRAAEKCLEAWRLFGW